MGRVVICHPPHWRSVPFLGHLTWRRQEHQCPVAISWLKKVMWVTFIFTFLPQQSSAHATEYSSASVLIEQLNLRTRTSQLLYKKKHGIMCCFWGNCPMMISYEGSLFCFDRKALSANVCYQKATTSFLWTRLMRNIAAYQQCTVVIFCQFVRLQVSTLQEKSSPKGLTELCD